jgi:hypothetical protein
MWSQKETWKRNEDIITIKGLFLENSDWTFQSNWTNLNISPSVPEQIDGVLFKVKRCKV